jgi:PAS domain S-box-containing protein
MTRDTHPDPSRSPYSAADEAPGASRENRVYRAIVNAIPDMIIRIGRDGIFRSFEGETGELYRPAPSYLGKHIGDVLPAEAARLFLERIDDAFRRGGVHYLEYALRFDKRLRHYEARVIRCTDDEALAIVRNVTPRKEIEAELLRYHEDLEALVEERTTELAMAERKYRSIFSHSGSAAIIVEADFTISMANPKFEELTGYPREEIEGRLRWIDFISEPDVERVRSYHYARRSGPGKAPEEYECRINDRTGRTRDIYIKVGMMPDPGRSVASLIDITSLKRTERELREKQALYGAILEGYDGDIYIISKDCRIQFMNESLVQKVGGDATGTLCYETLHHRQTPCLWCVREQVFQGEPIRFQIRNPGDGRWYASVNVPIRHSDGRVLFQAMITDIDEQKRLEEALRESEAHLRKENLRLRTTIQERSQFGDLVGRSQAMQEVYELILMAGASDANVILYGESGTGKELVANAIHTMSERRNRPFVPVNCGAIPENLLEREFFGHRKGAFTGADADKQGYLDEADGGTLFLDEIGEIKQEFQVKLLRAIEGGGFSPIGSNTLRKPDFRIIAATSRNLFQQVQEGGMRSDFFYRVHVVPIHLPPLRERKEDIPLLVEHFLKAYDRNIRPRLTPAVLDKLTAYDWPGNVRELQNAIYRFVALKRLDLANGSPAPANPPAPAAAGPDAPLPPELPAALASFERQWILRALEQHRWNRTRTAQHLGIGLRTLQRKMRTHGIQ